jgi:outer membrane protein
MVRTTEAYFAVLRAADAVTVSESLVRANERTLDQSKQRFEVGPGGDHRRQREPGRL